MPKRHPFAAALLLAAVFSPPLQAQSEPQYLAEAKAASSKYFFDCYGGGEDDACAGLIAGYERAMQAPDADAGAVHALLKEKLQAIGVRGGHLREAGKLDAARTVLEAGYLEMMAHFDNGKHTHTLIENLRLQQHLVLLYAAQDRKEDRDTVLGIARGVADWSWDNRQQSASNENAVRLLHAAMAESELLETELGNFYRDRARSRDGTAAGEARKEALLAYGRAEQWLRRKSEHGIRGVMDLRGDLRLSQLQLEQGLLQLDMGEHKAAEESFLSSAIICLYLDPAEVRNRQLRPLDPFEAQIAGSLCERSSLGWGFATGSVVDAIRQATDEMIDRELEELEMLRKAAGG